MAGKWVHLTARHGGGHQSKSEKWEFYPYLELDEAMVEEIWDDWYEKEGFGGDSVYGEFEIVDSAPIEVVMKKIETEKSKLKSTKAYLAKLQIELARVKEATDDIK